MTATAAEPIFTIGHSTHPEARFMGMLLKHRITALADVRSSPYSRFNPQFNQEALAKALDERGIRYIFLGRELGGRSDDDDCYEQGRICYERVALTARFQSGLVRLLKGAKTHRIALMCAEGEPLVCHRTLLVAHALDGLGSNVQHMLSDGSLESHGETINRLLAQFGMNPEDDLVTNRADSIAAAIAHQAGQVAYVRPSTESELETRTS